MRRGKSTVGPQTEKRANGRDSDEGACYKIFNGDEAAASPISGQKIENHNVERARQQAGRICFLPNCPLKVQSECMCGKSRDEDYRDDRPMPSIRVEQDVSDGDRGE